MKKIIYAFILLQTMALNSGLFADEPAAPPRDQGMWQTLIMIGIAVLFGYFIIWRPEQKRRKTMEAQRSALKKGDRVTALGILGTVVSIKDNTVILKMFDGSKIEMLKGAINDVIPASEEEAKKVDREEKNSSKTIEITESNR